MAARKTTSRCIVWAVPALCAITACHLVLGPEDDQQWWYYCDASGCYRCNAAGCLFDDSYCQDDNECASGRCDLESGQCLREERTCEAGGECASGYGCFDGRCRQLQLPCQEDAACGMGAYCSNGTCKPSGLCDRPSDCDVVGDPFTCDARGCCVPQPGPKQCTSSDACGDGLCVDGQCGTCSGDCGGGQTCEIARHCGPGRSCLDGQCVSECDPTDSDACAVGQKCHPVLKVCSADTPAGCVKSDECGSGEACVDGRCHPDCTSNGQCSSAKETCASALQVGEQSLRVCVPDYAAAPECKLNKDCAGSEQCVNGTCRTVCDTIDDCALCEDGPVCGRGGFCMTAEEAQPACTRSSDCGDSDKVCLNSRCVSR